MRRTDITELHAVLACLALSSASSSRWTVYSVCSRRSVANDSRLPASPSSLLVCPRIQIRVSPLRTVGWHGLRNQTIE